MSSQLKGRINPPHFDSGATLKNQGKEDVVQINLDKKSGLLLGIIAALLVIVIVLLVDKVEDDDHFLESHSFQIVKIG